WWGDRSQTDRGGGGRDRRGDGRTQKDHTLACSERVRDQRLSFITGDTNDPKCVGFHSMKPRKVRGRSTNPEGRAVLRQAADESFVCASPHEATRVADPLELSQWGMPPVVLEAYKAVGISQLFPWQAECLTQSGALLGKNLVYSAPTSAGKTLVAEILVLKHLLEKHQKALITLPYVALAREKTNRLKNVWQGAGIRVGGFMGNESPPGGLAACDVAVCTIERANGLLNRLLEDGQLNLLGVIVVDELHMVAEPGRGALLELMLTKLLYLTSSLRQYKPIQIIAMSATLPDLRLLASWLRADFFHTDFRPVPLCEYIKVASNMELIREIKPSLKDDTDLVQELCHETVRAGHSVLAFCPSKQWCEALARAIANAFQQIPQGLPVFLSDRQNLLHELQQAGTTIDPVLSRTVPQGVAFHHAGLTMGERAVLEEAFCRGHLSVLVATTTLASGVNLTLTYQQMAGRAGRFGLDVQGEGTVLVAWYIGKMCTLFQISIIVSGVAKTADDACCYTSCTLLSTCLDNKEFPSSPAQCAKQKVNEVRTTCVLNKYGKVVELHHYIGSLLGKAALAAGLPPSLALAVFADLQRALRCLALDSDLHLLYLVTPLSDELPAVDWSLFLHLWGSLQPPARRVAELVGWDEGFVARAVQRGGRQVRATAKQDRQFAVHCRLFWALALADLLAEYPLADVAMRFGCNRGQLQALQQAAAQYAGMVTVFCTRLGWSRLATLLDTLQPRLVLGVRPELADLARITVLTAAAARALHHSGFVSVALLAGAEPDAVCASLTEAAPFASKRHAVDENEEEAAARRSTFASWVIGRRGLSELQTVGIILQEARTLFHHDVEALGIHWTLESAEGPLSRCKQHKVANMQRSFSQKYRNCSTPVGNRQSLSNEDNKTDLKINAIPTSIFGTQPSVNSVKEIDQQCELVKHFLTNSERVCLADHDVEHDRKVAAAFNAVPVPNDGERREWKTIQQVEQIKTEKEKRPVVVFDASSKRTQTCTDNSREFGQRAEMTSKDNCEYSVNSCTKEKWDKCQVSAEKGYQVKNDVIQNYNSLQQEASRSHDAKITQVIAFNDFNHITNFQTCTKDLLLDKVIEMDKAIFSQTTNLPNHCFASKINNQPLAGEHKNDDCSKIHNVCLMHSCDVLNDDATVSQSSRKESTIDLLAVTKHSSVSMAATSNNIGQAENKRSPSPTKMSSTGAESPEIFAFNISFAIDTQFESMLQESDSLDLEAVSVANAKTTIVGNGLSPLSSGAVENGGSADLTLSFHLSNTESIIEKLGSDGHCNLHSTSHMLGTDAAVSNNQQMMITLPELDTYSSLMGLSHLDESGNDLFEGMAEMGSSVIDEDSREGMQDSFQDLSYWEKWEKSNCSAEGEVEFSAHFPVDHSGRDSINVTSASFEGICLSAWTGIDVEAKAEFCGADGNSVGMMVKDNDRPHSSGNSILEEFDLSDWDQVIDNEIENGEVILCHKTSVSKYEQSVISPQSDSQKPVKNSSLKEVSTSCVLLKDPGSKVTKDAKESKDIEQSLELSPTMKDVMDALFVLPQKQKTPSVVAKSVSTISRADHHIQTPKVKVQGATQTKMSCEESSEEAIQVGIPVQTLTRSQENEIGLPCSLDDVDFEFMTDWEWESQELSDKINSDHKDNPQTKTKTPGNEICTSGTKSEKGLNNLLADNNDHLLAQKHSSSLEATLRTPRNECGDCETPASGNVVQELQGRNTAQRPVDANNTSILCHHQNAMTSPPTIAIEKEDTRTHTLKAASSSILLHANKVSLEGGLFIVEVTRKRDVFRAFLAEWALQPRFSIAVACEWNAPQPAQRNIIGGRFITRPVLPEVQQVDGLVIPDGKGRVVVGLAVSWDAQNAYYISLRLGGMFEPNIACRHFHFAFHDVEMASQPGLACLELNGLAVNWMALHSLQASLAHRLVNLESSAVCLAPRPFKLSSHSDIAHMPNDETKVIRTATLQKLTAVHPLPGLILEWRRVSHTLNMAVLPLLRCHSSRLYPFGLIFTSTGRIVFAEPNLQNIPKSFVIGKSFFDHKHHGVAIIFIYIYIYIWIYMHIFTLREFQNEVQCFTGFCMLAADYSQLELRLLAHMANDNALHQALQPDRDIFLTLAARWSNQELDKVDDSARQKAKQVCYGIVYGIGVRALADQLGVDEFEAGAAIENFKSTFPDVKRFLKESVEFCRRYGFVETLSGRRRYVPAINDPEPQTRAHAERQAVNSRIQGSAADIIKLSMAALHRKLAHLVTPSGNMFLFFIPLHQVAVIVKSTMETVMRLKVALVVRIKSGQSWGDLHDLDL
uniref:DNA-directed DNA polymerase n=1 Tax=Eptatretus burgeri TaxID=7764 RepID=A0A8C4Q9F1_EPTBU